MDPFDFISDFGKDYYHLRSPHANFGFKYYYLPFLYYFPMSSEEIIHFNVTYENGNSFNTNFIILSDINIKENKTENLLNLETTTEKFSLYNINQYRNNLEKLINNKNNLKILKEEDIIKWDYEFEDEFKCRVDETNEINVYFINSFMGEDEDLYNNTIVKCAQLFDKNTYPITFISNFNPGGSADICHTLLETISPLIKINYYAAVRKTDNFLKNAEIYDEWKELSTEKCEYKSMAEIIKNGEKIDYGNGITDILSQPYNEMNKETRKLLDIFKSQLIHKRKPTDIITIADGFSFSSTSMFLKFLQYYGGGITVGIFGHPRKKNIPFDSSLSPTTVFGNETLYEFSEDYKELYDNYKINMLMGFAQPFYTPNNLSIPLEYVITPVDESQPFYKEFSDENYKDFIKLAKNIHQKYKTECNPKNKKLVKVSSECDKYFENNYTHGGYECGDDGKWSNKCVPSYCDLEYMFDYNESRCVKDYCSDLRKEENKDKDKDKDKESDRPNEDDEDDDDDGMTTTELVIIICASVVVVIVVIIIIVMLFLNKKKKDSHEELLSSISMSIQDREDAKLYA